MAYTQSLDNYKAAQQTSMLSTFTDGCDVHFMLNIKGLWVNINL